MVDAAVVPNSQVVDVLPSVADLQIVVFDDQLNKPVQEVLGLIICQAMDVLDVMADSKDALPTGNRVGTNNWVNGFKHIADVFGSSSRSGKERESIRIGGLFETRLCVVGSQAVQEVLQRLGDAIVELIPRCPQCI